MSDEAEMDVSISDPNPIGPVEWCGIIWTEQEIRDGVTKTVPATKYEDLDPRERAIYDRMKIMCRKDEDDTPEH